jgi:hypothetical protein
MPSLFFSLTHIFAEQHFPEPHLTQNASCINNGGWRNWDFGKTSATLAGYKVLIRNPQSAIRNP